MSESRQSVGTAQWFATTHWSVVLAAGANDVAQAGPALEALCRAYWPPIYGFLRRLGRAPAEAQDLTQEFFHRLLEKKQFAGAKAESGRFRSFLLVHLKHFLNDQHKYHSAQKRGGGSFMISMEDEETAIAQSLELATFQTPEKEFDRRWAIALMERALERLRGECEGSGKGRLFEQLKPFLEHGTGHGQAAVVAEQLGLTANAVAVSIHRLRARYRELVREEIAAIVAAPAQIEDELRHLIAALA